MAIFMNFRRETSSWTFHAFINFDRIIQVIILILIISSLTKAALITWLIKKLSSSTSSALCIINIFWKLYRILMLIVTNHRQLPIILYISFLCRWIAITITKREIVLCARPFFLALYFSIWTWKRIFIIRTFFTTTTHTGQIIKIIVNRTDFTPRF